MRSWSVILGGQSSFDHAHVESLKKNSRWDPGLSYWGVNHLLTMHMLNLYKKILGEILVCHTGGSIIFWPCTCWIFKKNSRWDPGLSYWGVNHLLTMHMLNLYKKILGEILVCHTGGSIIFWPCTCWIFKKILGEILVCHTGGSIIFWPCMLNLYTLKF